MKTDDQNKLELTAIRPEMSHEEVYQSLLAALKRQGIKVHGTEEKKPKNEP